MPPRCRVRFRHAPGNLRPGTRVVTRARGEQVWHEKLLLWPVRTGCSQGVWLLEDNSGAVREEAVREWHHVLLLNVKGHPVDFTGEVVAAISQTVTDDEMVGKIQRAKVEARRRREMRNIPVHLGGEFGAEPLCCVTWDGRPLAAPHSLEFGEES